MKVLQYLKARALESSTWADIGLAIAAAAVHPAPWSYWMFGVSLAKALLKDWKIGGAE